jgi:hypothetical protein
MLTINVFLALVIQNQMKRCSVLKDIELDRPLISSSSTNYSEKIRIFYILGSNDDYNRVMRKLSFLITKTQILSLHGIRKKQLLSMFVPVSRTKDTNSLVR